MVSVFLLLEAVYCLYPHLFGSFRGFFDSVIPLRGLDWFALGMSLRLGRISLPRLRQKAGGGVLLVIAVILSFVSAYTGYRSFFMFLASPFVMGFFWLVASLMKLHPALKTGLSSTFIFSLDVLFARDPIDRCLATNVSSRCFCHYRIHWIGETNA